MNLKEVVCGYFLTSEGIVTRINVSFPIVVTFTRVFIYFRIGTVTRSLMSSLTSYL